MKVNKLFWIICIVVAALIVGLLLVPKIIPGTSNQITVCVDRDYQGGSDMGPCTEQKTVEIVASPEKASECPVDTEPVYDIVGGIVGKEFVGCARK